MNRTVELYSHLAARHLVKIINILRYYGLKLSLLLKANQRLVRLVRFRLGITEFALIKVIEFLRVFYKKRMADDVDGTVG